MQTLARILRTISYSPTGLSITLESMHKSPFVLRVSSQPNWPSSWLKTEISERQGTAFITDLPAAKIAAAIIGREAFLEPFILTAPESRTGPSMRNISIIYFPWAAPNSPQKLNITERRQKIGAARKFLVM
jgi:hypothetical protein